MHHRCSLCACVMCVPCSVLMCKTAPMPRVVVPPLPLHQLRRPRAKHAQHQAKGKSKGKGKAKGKGKQGKGTAKVKGKGPMKRKGKASQHHQHRHQHQPHATKQGSVGTTEDKWHREKRRQHMQREQRRVQAKQHAQTANAVLDSHHNGWRQHTTAGAGAIHTQARNELQHGGGERGAGVTSNNGGEDMLFRKRKQHARAMVANNLRSTIAGGGGRRRGAHTGSGAGGRAKLRPKPGSMTAADKAAARSSLLSYMVAPDAAKLRKQEAAIKRKRKAKHAKFMRNRSAADVNQLQQVCALSAGNVMVGGCGMCRGTCVSCSGRGASP